MPGPAAPTGGGAGHASGGEHEKRWQDVEEILEAGIDVISTVNIQHLESLNDVVESITGIRQQETVPDEVVRRADQVQLVDMSPEALRRRMAHGNIYGPDQVDAALAQLLPGRQPLGPARDRAAVARRPGRRGARALPGRPGHQRPWPARERVVVALTGGAGSETLLRRGARIATRAAGGDLIACHVQSAEGLTSTDPAALARLRTLAGDLGAEFQNVSGPDVAEAILDHARGVNATQIVVGVSRRSRLAADPAPEHRRPRSPTAPATSTSTSSRTRARRSAAAAREPHGPARPSGRRRAAASPSSPSSC